MASRAPAVTARADASGWTVRIDDVAHRIEIGQDTVLHGRPTSFSCDGVRHPLKLPALWYGKPVTMPFGIGGVPASLTVSVKRLSVLQRLLRAPEFLLGGGMGDVWTFALAVDEHPLGSISREPGANRGLLSGIFGSRATPTEPLPTFALELPPGWVSAPFTAAGRDELKALVMTDWPTMTELLEGPPPENLLSVVHLAVDLKSEASFAKPNLFTVAEYDAIDLECEMRHVRQGLLDQSDAPPVIDYLEVPAGRAGRMVRTWHAPAHQAEEVAAWTSGLFVTYRIHGGGTCYELQFETPAYDPGPWVPIFDNVLRSFRQVVDRRAANAGAVLPHQEPALEALVPPEILGRPVCTYSVRAGQGGEGTPPIDTDVQIAVALGLSGDDVALVGSVSADPHAPPYGFTGVRFPGASEEQLMAALGPAGEEGWALVSERTVAGRRLFLVSEQAMPEMPSGRTYLFFVGDTRWFVSTGLDPWLEEFVAAVGAGAS